MSHCFDNPLKLFCIKGTSHFIKTNASEQTTKDNVKQQQAQTNVQTGKCLKFSEAFKQ